MVFKKKYIESLESNLFIVLQGMKLCKTIFMEWRVFGRDE